MEPYFRQYQPQFSPEQLRDQLRKQLEYYFSRENLTHDIYLQSQMDADNYVPISLIASFKLVKRLTNDLQLIIDVLKESPSVEVDIEEKKVRSLYVPTRKRCIIILRNVPYDAKENEILELFINKSCPVSPIGCERVLESDHLDCWYVTFNTEDDAQNAFLYLTQENISIRGQKILARMKACLLQKASTPSNLVQTNQTIGYLPQQYYDTNKQQMHMTFQHNRTQPVVPGQFWYVPIPTTDPYTQMYVPLDSIIRTNRSKNWIRTSKPQEVITNHEEHSQNNIPHSDDNNSSVLHNETLLNSKPSLSD